MYTQFIISFIQAEYNSKVEASNQISRSHIKRMLTEDLKYSYKLWDTLSLKNLAYESIRWYYESVAILRRMKQQDLEVIFFDLCSEIKKSSFYVWSKKKRACFPFKKWKPILHKFMIGNQD